MTWGDLVSSSSIVCPWLPYSLMTLPLLLNLDALALPLPTFRSDFCLFALFEKPPHFLYWSWMRLFFHHLQGFLITTGSVLACSFTLLVSVIIFLSRCCRICHLLTLQNLISFSRNLLLFSGCFSHFFSFLLFSSSASFTLITLPFSLIVTSSTRWANLLFIFS